MASEFYIVPPDSIINMNGIREEVGHLFVSMIV